MSLKSKLLAGIAGVSLLIAITGPAVAPVSAATRADVSVTIGLTGDSSFAGQVSGGGSVCTNNRPVRLFEQVGASQNHSTDPVAASTTSSGSGAWAISKAGLYGKFYAHTRISADCKPASSTTVTSTKAT